MKNILRQENSSILHVLSVNGPVITVVFHKLNSPSLGDEIYFQNKTNNWISLGTVDIIKTTTANIVVDDKSVLYKYIKPNSVLMT